MGAGSSINLRSQQTEFNKQSWLNKASFELSSANVGSALGKMNQLVDVTGERTLKRELKPNYGVYMFTIKKNQMGQLRNQLSQIGNIGSEVETVDTSLVNTNYENEQANLASYEKDLAELDKIRVPSDQELRRKESLRGQIKVTQLKIENLQRGDSFLIYVSIVPSKREGGTTQMVKNFALSFVKYLILCFVGVVLVYFGTRLLMYLLAMLGVKGLGTGGAGGSYQYGGYTNYAGKYSSRYGYSRGKRKIKRVYKDSSGSEENNKEPE